MCIQGRKCPPFPSSMAAVFKIQPVSAYVHRDQGVLALGQPEKVRPNGKKAAQVDQSHSCQLNGFSSFSRKAPRQSFLTGIRDLRGHFHDVTGSLLLCVCWLESICSPSVLKKWISGLVQKLFCYNYTGLKLDYWLSGQ